MNALQFGESSSLVLVDVAAKGTVLLAAACMARMALRRSSAALRHRLWGLTMGSLLLLPALSWLLPAWRLPILPVNTGHRTSDWTSIHTDSERQFSAQRRADESANDKIARAAAMTEMDFRSALPADSTDSRSPRPIEPSVAPPGAAMQFARLTPVTAVLVWCLGAVLLLTGVALGIHGTGRLWRGSQSITDEAWSQLTRELSRRLGLRRAVGLREHEEPLVPLTWGLLRPIILLPLDARRWPEAMRRAVLLHELAHVRRGDVAYQLLGRVTCALYWFHPLAWYALRQLRQEREQACDDAVIGSGERASDYAEQLLEVARECRRSRGLVLAVEITRGGSLEQRVRALFDAARSHAPVGRRTAVALLAAAGMLASAIAVMHPVAVESHSVAAELHSVGAEPQGADDASAVATREPPPDESAPGEATGSVDHLQRYRLEFAHAQRRFAAKKPQEALPFLKSARRELALVRDDDLVTEQDRRHGSGAVRARSACEWQMVLSLIFVGDLENSIEIADGIQSPGFQADALSKIAVKLGALGQRDTAIKYVDRALTVALNEKTIPQEFARFWGYQEAAWRFLGLEAVGEACDTLGDLERTDQVVKLLQNERGQKGDAYSLLLTIARRQQAQGDEPGLQRTLARMADASDSAELATENIASFWKDICNALIESGRFDDAASHLDKLNDRDRDRVRAGLVRGWSRNDQLERATQEMERISEPSSRATAMIFLARAAGTAGKNAAAASMLSAAIELVRVEQNFFVKVEPLVLAAETLALWGDYAAAERDAKQFEQAISDGTLYMYSLWEGPHSDYFEMPFQILVGPQTSWLLIARAQLRAGNIDDAIKTIERIVDVPERRIITESYRSYFFGLVTRELLRTGNRDRVRKLLSDEPYAAVREVIEVELNAAAIVQEQFEPPAPKQNDNQEKDANKRAAGPDRKPKANLALLNQKMETVLSEAKAEVDMARVEIGLLRRRTVVEVIRVCKLTDVQRQRL